MLCLGYRLLWYYTTGASYASKYKTTHRKCQTISMTWTNTSGPSSRRMMIFYELAGGARGKLPRLFRTHTPSFLVPEDSRRVDEVVLKRNSKLCMIDRHCSATSRSSSSSYSSLCSSSSERSEYSVSSWSVDTALSPLTRVLCLAH